MFGVKLSAPVVELLEEVEALYKKKVWANGPVEMSPHQEAASGVSPDGVPCVRFNPRASPTEELIAHELSHLRLSALGFPYVFTVSSIPLNDLERMQFFVNEVYDTIEHTIIYPQMRAMGLRPDVRMARDIVLAMTHGYRYGGLPERAVQALYLFQATMLLGDAGLLTRFTQWYERKGWDVAVAVSSRLAERFKVSRPETPHAAIATLVDCLNLLDLGGDFRPYGAETRKVGSHDLQIVYLKYTPQ